MSEMNEPRRDALPPGARLDGDKYAIEEVLGAGGFGLVYRVRHLLLDEERAIKEYLPSEIAVREGETVYARSGAHESDYRDGLDRFLKEAQQLVRFDGHPNIIRCRDYFEANGTAYLVMDFEDGLPLDTFLARREAQGQPLEESELRHLLGPLLEGLATVHAEDVLHRDIKPGNVFVRRRDGQPVLLDFGAAKADFSKHSRSRAPHTPGYAAPEQVEDEGHLGPWTDVYAVGALMWRAVTGSAPPKVESRLSALRPGRTDPLVIDADTGGGRFSADLLEVMRKCLHLDEARRPQSAEALLDALSQGDAPLDPAPEPKPDTDTDTDPDPDSPQETEPTKTEDKWGAFFGCGALLLFVIYGSFQTSPEPIPPPAGLEVFRDTLKDGGEGPEMVVLLTGGFRMGSPDGEEDRYSDEGPQRTVTISQRIAMGRYEVTFAEYDRFVSATSGVDIPDDEGWGRGSRPVINVSQEDAKAYAAWLSAQTGKTYRLPTEAEWEYAARAGTRTRYSWGDNIGRYRANCDGCGGFVDNLWDDIWDNYQTAPVGSFAANAFGLFDMHGNVWEWVEDCYVDSYAGAPIDGSARSSGCGSDVRAVVRGGSWNYNPRLLRAAFRFWSGPSDRDSDFGFRLVQDLNP